MKYHHSLQIMSRTFDEDTDRITFTPLRALSDGEFEAVEAAVRILSSYIQGSDRFWMIAVGDLEATMNEVATEILDDLRGLRSVEWWIPKITYRLINLSLTLRMFEEYVNAEIIRAEEPNGRRAEQVKAEFSRTYDQSISYRILYDLRNTLAHGSSRAVEVSANLALDAEDDSRELTLSVTLNRDAVMARAKSIVKRDLGSLDTDPDLLTIIEQVARDIKELNQRLNRHVFPEVLDSSRLIGRYLVEAQEAGADTFLFASTSPVGFRFNIAGVALNHLVVSADVLAQVRVQLEYDADPQAARWQE